MDDLPSLQEVLENVQPQSPPILPPLNLNINAEQLASLIESSVTSALARREALATSSSSLVAVSVGEMSTVPEKAVSTSPIPSNFSPATHINQSPTAEPTTPLNIPIPVSVRKPCNERVPQKDHRKTNVTSQSEIVKHCICPRDENKHQKLFRMHLILRSEGLLSMLLRIRAKPTIDMENNPYGYSPMRQHDIMKNPVLTGDISQVETDAMSLHSSSTVVSSATTTLAIVPTSTIWVVEADDMLCYDHDMARLYSLVTLMFHTDYHCHASINSELCADAIYFYQSIIKVVFGQPPIDVFQARKEFFNFKLNLHKSIQSEFQRWEQKIRNVQWALLNVNAIPESEKLAFIICFSLILVLGLPSLLDPVKHKIWIMQPQ